MENISKEIFGNFKKENNEFASKMNKLNMLRNLSKINKEKRAEDNPNVVLSDNMKDEIYKRGIGNVLKLSNFLKNRKENNSPVIPQPSRKMSPTSMVKESIKHYIKNNNTNLQKYNENMYSDEEGGLHVPQPIDVNNTENMMKEYAEKIKEQNATKKNFYKIHHNNNFNEDNKINEVAIEEEKFECEEPVVIPGMGEGNISEIKNVSNRHIMDIDMNKDILSDSFEVERPPKYNKTNNNGGRPLSGKKVSKDSIQSIDKKIINEIESKKTASQQVVLTEPKQTNNDSNKLNYVNELRPISAKKQVIEQKNHLNIAKKDIEGFFNNAFSGLDGFEKKINRKLDHLEKRISNNNKCVTSLIEKQFQTFQFNMKNIEAEVRKVTEERVYKDTVEKMKKEFENSAKRDKEPAIVTTWKNVLKDIENNNLNTAYARILETGKTLYITIGDDIYLLRLLCMTGPVIQKLNPEIAKNVILRINLISRSHKIQSLTLELINNAYTSDIFDKFKKDDQNELLETLYEFSGINSEIGTRAAELYTKITSEIIN
jgi:hypothetical protein